MEVPRRWVESTWEGLSELQKATFLTAQDRAVVPFGREKVRVLDAAVASLHLPLVKLAIRHGCTPYVTTDVPFDSLAWVARALLSAVPRHELREVERRATEVVGVLLSVGCDP